MLDDYAAKRGGVGGGQPGNPDKNLTLRLRWGCTQHLGKAWEGQGESH